MDIWNRWLRKKLERKRRAAQQQVKEAQRRKANGAGKLAMVLNWVFALESLETWKKRVRKWFAAWDKSQAKNAFARAQRRLTLENLEPRQMLSGLPTTTTISRTSSTVDQGTSVALVATVAPTSGSSTPGGVVEFYGPSSFYLGTAPLNPASGDTATATLTTTEIPAGTDEAIEAVYEGNANFATSSDATTMTVLPVVAPVVTASNSAPVVGQPVTLSARLSAGASGAVTFDDNASPISEGEDITLQPGADTDALTLDGTSGYVSLPSENLKFTDSDFTVSEWFCPAANNVSGFIFQRGLAYGDQQGDIGLHVDYWTGHMEFEIFSGAGWVLGWDVPESSLHASVSAGNWNHVLVTRSDYTNYSLWMNGQFIGTQTSSADISDDSNTNPIIIGGMASSSGVQNFFQGSISELEIWDTALDTDDVATMNNGGSLFASDSKGDYPASTDLVAAYHLNGDANDFSGNRNDGTLSTTGASWTANTASVSSASFSTTFTSTGAHTITAVYSDASGTFAPSTSAPLAMVVLDTTLPGGGTIVNVPPNQAAPSPLTDGSLVLPFAPAGLTYVSNSNGNATVSVDATPGTIDPSNRETLTQIAATLTVGGYSNTVYYDASDIAADTSYRFTVPINGANLPTGCYAYTMTFMAFSADDPGGRSMTSLNETAGASGITNVLNWTNSPFGQGWNLDGLDQLTFDGSGNVSYVRSDGAMGYFTLNSDERTFTAPAGPFAFLQLSTDGSGNYWLNDPSTGTTEAFNSSGALVTVTDHDGNVTSYNWTEYSGPIYYGDELSSIAYPNGHTTTLTYGSEYPVVWITDFAGRTTRLGFDAGQLTRINEPDPGDGETPPVTYFSYAAPNSGFTYGGPLTCVIDANGNGTEFAYRNDGTLAAATAANGSSVQYQDAISPLPRGDGEAVGELSGGDPTNPVPLILAATAVGVVTDQNGSPTVYTFDKFGDPTSVENALGYTTAYERDSNGLVTDMVQPDLTTTDAAYGQPFESDGSVAGRQTFYSYDTDSGMMTGETDPSGAMQSWSYIALSTLGGNYVVPTHTSEGFGVLPAGAAPPINQIQSFDWSATTGGTPETYTYNSDPSSSEEGGGTPAIYDNPAGDYFRATNSDGTVTWTYYAPGDDPLSVDPDPTYNAPDGWSAISFPPHVVDYDYYRSDETGGNAGDLKSVTERDWPSNVVTQYTYTMPPAGGSVCPAGLVLTVEDPNGNVTTNVYNTTGAAAGLVSQVELPSDPHDPNPVLVTPDTSIYYGYDSTTADLTSVSNPVAPGTTLSSLNTTYYSSDGLDRLVSETDPEDSSGNCPTSISIYDAMGNVTSQQVLQAIVSGLEVWQTTTYTYNSLNQLWKVDAPGPDGSAIRAETTYTYTPTGMPYQVTDATGGIETFGYDALDEQTSASLPDPATGAAGGPTSYTAYDPLGRVTSQTSLLPPGEVPGEGLDATTYSYSFGTTSGPGATLTTTLPDPTYGTNDEGPVTTDSYDQNGDLVSETAPSPAGGSPTTTSYQYDALGHPVQQQVDSSHPWLGPKFDGDGNVTSDSDLENGAVTSYTYNARNELVQTTGPYPDPEHAISGGVPTPVGDSVWSHEGSVPVTVPVVTEHTAPVSPDGTGGGVGYTISAKTITHDTVTDYSNETGNTLTWSFDSLTAGQQYEFQVSLPDSGSSDLTPNASFSYINGTDSSVSIGNYDEALAARADYTSIHITGDETDTTNWQGIVVFTAEGTTASFELDSGTGNTLIPDVQLQKARPVTTYAYNAAGDMTSETDPLGATTAWTYDADGNQIGIKLPDPANGQQDGNSPATTTGYDLVGNVVSVTSPSPTGSGYATTINTYDLQNNLVSTKDANSAVTTFTHNALGETLSLTDPDRNSTSWTYDHTGQQTSQSETVALGYFSAGTVQTTLATSYDFYDPAGNLTTSIDADGRSISYTYDHLSDETGETWTDASGNTVGGVSFAYNSAGYMTSAGNAAATYGFYYDISGNVADASANLPGADGTTVQLGATYDYNGNMTSLAVNIGGEPNFHVGDFTGFTGGVNDFTNNYAYDPMGDMTSVTQTGNGVSDKNVVMGYDPSERLSGVDMYQSDGTSSLVAAAGYTYNGDSELTGLTYNTLADGTGTVLAGYHWDYNAAGAVSDMYSHNDSNATTPNTTFTGTGSNWGKATYSYDPTAQLLGASYSTYFANPPTTDAGKTYDPNGNRTNVTPVSPTSTTTGADNRLLFDGTYYYTYDAEGNRTAKYQISGGSDKSLGTQSSPNSNAENITIYTWDNANQLASATFYNSAAHWSAGTITAAGEWTVTYGNDVFGRMVTRAATVTNADLSQTTTTENFVYDGRNIALILDGSGNVVERELTGPAPDQVFASENASSGVVNWYLTDNQGTVRDVVQSDGTTTTEVDHLVYSAYGQLTDQTAAPDVGERPTFYYNGTWQDPQTGMNKMGLRWADLADAVFASKDPIGFWSGTTNLSEYVGNSPTNFSDPSGMVENENGNAPQGVGSESSACGCVHRPVGTVSDSEGTGLAAGIVVMRQWHDGGGWDGGPGGGGPGFGGPGFGGPGFGGGAPENGGVASGGGDDPPAVCFAAGTNVVMADGTSKPIEQIECGDAVQAVFHEDAEGPISSGEVIEVYHHEPRNVLRVEVAGHTIVATPKHPFYVRGRGWTAAEDLRSGDLLRNGSDAWVSVGSINSSGEIQRVYNFQVRTLHSYFVRNGEGSANILVHNQSGGPFRMPIRGAYDHAVKQALQNAPKKTADVRVVTLIQRDKAENGKTSNVITVPGPRTLANAFGFDVRPVECELEEIDKSYPGQKGSIIATLQYFPGGGFPKPTTNWLLQVKAVESGPLLNTSKVIFSKGGTYVP